MRFSMMKVYGLLSVFLILTGCTPVKSVDTLTVSAAANLIPAFEEIGQAFKAETGITVTYNFGSSGKLVQQIGQGAPADVFAAANVAYVQQLADKGLIIPVSVQNYARGRLVLWSRDPSSLPKTISQLTDTRFERVAIANPEHAPYGMVAKTVLKNSGMWDALQPKLVFGNDVRQTLTYAQSGDVAVALVPLSLVINLDGGKYVLVPDTLHAPINQALGIVSDSAHPDAAQKFVAFVLGDAGQSILKKYGYESVKE